MSKSTSFALAFGVTLVGAFTFATAPAFAQDDSDDYAAGQSAGHALDDPSGCSGSGSYHAGCFSGAEENEYWNEEQKRQQEEQERQSQQALDPYANSDDPSPASHEAPIWRDESGIAHAYPTDDFGTPLPGYTDDSGQHRPLPPPEAFGVPPG
jgi:hypothetical protein